MQESPQAKHVQKPTGSLWLTFIALGLCALLGKWGCYGTIPGKFTPDGGAEASADQATPGADTTPKDAQEPVLRSEPPSSDSPDATTLPDTPTTEPPIERAAPDQSAPEAPVERSTPDIVVQPDEIAPEKVAEVAPEPPTPSSRCLRVDPPMASGKTLTLSPGKTLKDLLAQASGGDKIVVKQGTYPYESLTNVKFNKYVVIEAEAGTKPVFEGIDFKTSTYIAFIGLHIRKKPLAFRDCHHIWIDNLDIDMANNNVSGLQIVGSGSSPDSHHFEVHNSRISGGQRTVFVRTNFSPLVNWNYELRFTYNNIECGTNNCFQFSGARDTLIQNNTLKTKLGGGGILIAGGTRIEVRRNLIVGDINHSKFQSAMNIATPGKEWDNYKNVKYMITSHIKVGNNLMHSWSGFGVALNGTRNIDIFNNTMHGNKSAGLRLIRRTPHDTDGNIILTGNTTLRLWNNIISKVALDNMEPRPVLESNNLVEQGGGGGQNLLTSPPKFVDSGKQDYRLQASSPAINKGLVNPDTPKLDLYNTSRDSQPDIGAIEAGSQAPTCP